MGRNETLLNDLIKLSDVSNKKRCFAVIMMHVFMRSALLLCKLRRGGMNICIRIKVVQVCGPSFSWLDGLPLA